MAFEWLRTLGRNSEINKNVPSPVNSYAGSMSLPVLSYSMAIYRGSRRSGASLLRRAPACRHPLIRILKTIRTEPVESPNLTRYREIDCPVTSQG